MEASVVVFLGVATRWDPHRRLFVRFYYLESSLVSKSVRVVRTRFGMSVCSSAPFATQPSHRKTRGADPGTAGGENGNFHFLGSFIKVGHLPTCYEALLHSQTLATLSIAFPSSPPPSHPILLQISSSCIGM